MSTNKVEHWQKKNRMFFSSFLVERRDFDLYVLPRFPEPGELRANRMRTGRYVIFGGGGGGGRGGGVRPVVVMLLVMVIMVLRGAGHRGRATVALVDRLPAPAVVPGGRRRRRVPHKVTQVAHAAGRDRKTPEPVFLQRRPVRSGCVSVTRLKHARVRHVSVSILVVLSV